MSQGYITKPGKHGTLYRYEVAYQDCAEPDNNGKVYYWAYDAEHAEERFYDSPDADGWNVVGKPKRLRQSLGVR